MLEHNSTPYIGERIKLFNERDAVCYKDTCFGWKQPIRSYNVVYLTVRIDSQIVKILRDLPKIWRATWLSTAARQSSRRTLLSVSTILNVKRDNSYRSARAYTARAREIRACCPPLSYSHQTKGKYVPIKRHKPLFLSQIRTGITESNKSIYLSLLLQSYHHEVTVPNPVQERNLNVLLLKLIKW